MRAEIILVTVGGDEVKGPAIRLIPESDLERYALMHMRRQGLRELSSTFRDGLSEVLIGYQDVHKELKL